MQAAPGDEIAVDVAERVEIAETVPGTGASGRSRKLPGRGLLTRVGVLVFTIALFGLFSVIEPAQFFTSGNVETIINSQAVTMFLALAYTIMLRSGGVDFSLAYNMILTASIVAVLTTNAHVAVLPACLIGLAVAAAVGASNALLCVWFGLNTFIVTLGMGTVLAGIAVAVTGNTVVSGIPSGLTNLTATTVGPGIQLGAIYGVIAAVIVWFVLERTRFGRNLSVSGGNRVVAQVAGLKVRRIKAAAFCLGGVIAGIAGIVITGSQGSVDPTTATDYLLGPLTAAFLGATTIQMGRFNIGGTVVALYLVTVATTGLTLLGVSPWVSQVFNGGALVGAMVFARLTTPRREGHAAASRFTQG